MALVLGCKGSKPGAESLVVVDKMDRPHQLQNVSELVPVLSLLPEILGMQNDEQHLRLLGQHDGVLAQDVEGCLSCGLAGGQDPVRRDRFQVIHLQGDKT